MATLLFRRWRKSDCFEMGVTDQAPAMFTQEQLAEKGIDAAAGSAAAAEELVRQTAANIAWTSFADICVFFAVLMVGFAYVWRRGDLDWVRAVTSQQGEVVERASPRSMEVPPRATGSILSA